MSVTLSLQFRDIFVAFPWHVRGISVALSCDFRCIFLVLIFLNFCKIEPRRCSPNRQSSQYHCRKTVRMKQQKTKLGTPAHNSKWVGADCSIELARARSIDRARSSEFLLNFVDFYTCLNRERYTTHPQSQTEVGLTPKLLIGSGLPSTTY